MEDKDYSALSISKWSEAQNIDNPSEIRNLLQIEGLVDWWGSGKARKKERCETGGNTCNITLQCNEGILHSITCILIAT